MSSKIFQPPATLKSKLFLVIQVLLGLIYFVLGGLNGFLNFIPAPENLPNEITAFFEAMMATGYLFYLLKIVELVCGFLLVINVFAKISLVILAPVTLNIFFFNLSLFPEGLPMSIGLVIMHLILGYQYRDTYKVLFSVK